MEEREDWRSLVQMISIKEEPGDTISIISTDKPPLDHYYHGSGPVYFIKDEAVPLNKIDKLLMELVVDNLPPVKSRLWVGYRHVGSEARHRMYRTVVREQFHVQQHWIFMDMDLFLVTPHSTSTQGL